MVVLLVIALSFGGYLFFKSNQVSVMQGNNTQSPTSSVAVNGTSSSKTADLVTAGSMGSATTSAIAPDTIGIDCKISDIINPKDELSQSDWSGKWILKGSDTFNNSQLDISHVTKANFIFSIDAAAGEDMGGLDNASFTDSCKPGKMTIRGDQATFTDYPYGDKEQCIITFTLSKDHKTLTVKDGNDTFGACGSKYAFGQGVYADGEYQKGIQIKQIGIKDSQIFAKYPQAYQVFANLVGDTYIKSFDSLSMLQSLGTDKQFGATVQYTSVAHSSSGSVIMVGTNNKIWAAFPDSDSSTSASYLRYFTNVPEWKDKLPQTISDWFHDSYDSRPDWEGSTTVLYMDSAR